MLFLVYRDQLNIDILFGLPNLKFVLIVSENRFSSRYVLKVECTHGSSRYVLKVECSSVQKRVCINYSIDEFSEIITFRSSSHTKQNHKQEELCD